MNRLSALCLGLLVGAFSFLGCGDDDGSAVDMGSPAEDSGSGDAGVEDMGPARDCVVVRTIEGATERAPAPDGIAGNGALEVDNSLIVGAFAPLDRPPLLAKTGGVLVDLHHVGQSDHLNEFAQLGGASQSFLIEYTSMAVSEQDADHAVIEMRGHLAPAPDTAEFAGMPPGEGIEMVTTYRFDCMDPRVRVRSTMTNTTPNTYFGTGAFGPIDTMLWGGRSIAPFCPSPGQGTECRPFDFSNPTASLVTTPYVGSTGSLDGDPASFALYSDTRPTLTGVHNDQVSVLGEIASGFANFPAGSVKSASRVLVVGDGADAASAVDVVLDDLAELGRMEVATVSGVVTLPDATIGSDPFRRPLVVLATPEADGDPIDPETWTPATTVRVAEDGTFSARVPAGPISWELRIDGRVPKRGSGGDAVAGETLDLGTLEADPAPILDVEVTDGTSGVVARIVVDGVDGTEDPLLGPTAGGAPSGNMTFTDGMGLASITIPPGTYDIYAVHGMGWSLARSRVTIDADGASVTLQVEPLDVWGSGFLTADLHVHSGASFDSMLPVDDRVLSYIAEGVDAIVSTEHDVIYDYTPALATVEATLPAEWRGRLRTFVGIESTTFVPWELFPHTAGHYNAFPVEVIEGAWKSGMPEDEFFPAATIYERLRALPSAVSEPLVQMNHGRSSRRGTVWLGYFDSCQFDPTAAFDDTDLCWANPGAMGTRAWDLDAMELINGPDVNTFINNSRDWFALLLNAPGDRLPVGTANSDSHGLSLKGQAGYPLTLLRTDDSLAALDDAALVDALRSGSVSGALGVFVWFSVRNADGSVSGEPGRAPVSLSGDVTVEVHVAAPPWIPVEELRVRVGGRVAARRSAAAGDWTEPADPYGTTGVVRFDGPIDLTLPAEDTFITVEAGVAIPEVADLDGDGIAETADNDGDGDVDADDQALGGIEITASPEPLSVIAIEAHPVGFANPVFIDVDGNGAYDAPGVPLVDGDLP